MRTQDQLELVRTSQVHEGLRPTDSSPKTILVHLQSDASVNWRLETALSMARACSAHLKCLHITPIEAYVAFDSFGGVFVMNDVIKALDQEQADLRSAIETKLGAEDVSWNYDQVTGNVASELISHAALADLVVVGREPHRRDLEGTAVGLLGDLLCRSRTPLFIPSEDSGPVDPTGVALIAWNGSYEAANAVRASVGLLRLASAVHVIEIKEAKDEAFPSTRVLEYLSRHDVHAEYSLVSAGDKLTDQAAISDMLATHAQAIRAAYLVMGGYNHSRVREFVFGGVTRTMLAHAPVPLLITR